MFVIQSSLTGESLPVEKFDMKEELGSKSALGLQNTCFLGTSVESGAATGVIVETGFKTYLGSMASRSWDSARNELRQRLSRFTWLMIYFMAVLVPLVFLIAGITPKEVDGVLQHDWKGAFFFAITVAVGLDAGDAADDRLGLPLPARSACRGRR